MATRIERRKFTRMLKLLNSTGVYHHGNILVMAYGYIHKRLTEMIDDESNRSKFLSKVSGCKILVGDENEKLAAITLLKSYGMSPTDNKFVLLK